MVLNNVYCLKNAYKFLLREQVGFAAVFDACVNVFLVVTLTHVHTDPYSLKKLYLYAASCVHVLNVTLKKTYIYAKSKDTVFNKSQRHGTFNYVLFCYVWIYNFREIRF